MKKRHIAFWIAFPISFVLVGAILIFLFDLTNGPLVLFILMLFSLVALAASSIILLNKKLLFRFIPFVSFVGVIALLLSLSKPSVERRSATLFPNPEKTEVIQLVNGKVQGAYTKDKQVEVYAGIPYAKAPVGDLRWKATQPVENWDGVKDCTYFAPKSMQSYGDPITGTLVEMYAEKGWHPDYSMHPNEPVSEDSLYLNIWRPASFEGKLPILVYIHGGSLTTGSSAFQEYNGETMARNGVIMITITYRLSIFGYFAHEDLLKENDGLSTGNYGLLDQIEALRWVNANAASFGGDVDNITIAGESAGSSSVSALCSSPLAKGLFKRAIGESSSIASFRAPHTFRSLDDALSTGKKIMKEFNVNSIEELRKVPATKLLTTQYSNSSMCVDGYALTKSPYEVYKAKENNEEALLNGYNVKEADAFVVPTFLFDPTNKNNIEARLADTFDKQAASEFMDEYRTEIEKDAFSTFNDIITAYWFMQPHRDWSYLAFDNGEDVYRYQFTKENGYLGTNHSGEMVYCYGNLDKTGKSFAYDQSDYDLSKTMVSYWANFVKSGNPNGEGLPTWEKMSAHNSPLLELGKEIAPIEEKAERAYRILDEWKNREAEKELNK